MSLCMVCWFMDLSGWCEALLYLCQEIWSVLGSLVWDLTGFSGMHEIWSLWMSMLDFSLLVWDLSLWVCVGFRSFGSFWMMWDFSWIMRRNLVRVDESVGIRLGSLWGDDFLGWGGEIWSAWMSLCWGSLVWGRSGLDEAFLIFFCQLTVWTSLWTTDDFFLSSPLGKPISFYSFKGILWIPDLPFINVITNQN